MSYDEGLAERLRDCLSDAGSLREQRMMGGLCLMLDGHMCCGVTGNDLMLRVGKEDVADALRDPHARPMEISGCRLGGFVLIDPQGIEDDATLAAWLDRARQHIATLPPR